MKNNIISRNHPFWGTYIGDSGDFPSEFSVFSTVILVQEIGIFSLFNYIGIYITSTASLWKPAFMVTLVE